MRAKEAIELIIAEPGLSVERCFDVQAKRVRIEPALLSVNLALLRCVAGRGLQRYWARQWGVRVPSERHHLPTPGTKHTSYQRVRSRR